MSPQPPAAVAVLRQIPAPLRRYASGNARAASPPPWLRARGSEGARAPRRPPRLRMFQRPLPGARVQAGFMVRVQGVQAATVTVIQTVFKDTVVFKDTLMVRDQASTVGDVQTFLKDTVVIQTRPSNLASICRPVWREQWNRFNLITGSEFRG